MKAKVLELCDYAHELDENGWRPAAIEMFREQCRLMENDLEKWGAKYLLIALATYRHLEMNHELYLEGLPPERRAMVLEQSAQDRAELRKLEDKIYEAAKRHIREHLRRGTDPEDELTPYEYAEFLKRWPVRKVTGCT